MEQRDPDAESTATQLILVFATSFRNITFTLHPGDISGEVAGKSSNVSWAARQLSHNYVDSESRRNCVITVLDGRAFSTILYYNLLITSVCSRHPSFVKLLPTHHKIPPRKPVRGSHNTLLYSHNFRPKFERCQPVCSSGRYLLVWSWHIRSLQRLSDHDSHLGIFYSHDACWGSRGMGYRP